MPVETLQQIFVLIPVATAYKRDELPAHLVPIHVCQSWRSAALSCAEIWAYAIPLNNTAITALALERSRDWNEVLIIDAQPGSFIDPDALSLALEEPSRIEELTCPAIQESHGIMRETIHLRSLNIWEEAYAGSPYYEPDLPYCDYTEADALGGPVRLRLLEELRLHGNRIRFTARLLRDLPLLTTLELTLPHMLWPSLDILLAALPTMPQLKSLALRNEVLPLTSNLNPQMPNARSMVRLYHLEQLCLTGSSSLLSCMLHHLFIPKCTRLALILRLGQDRVWDDEHRLDQRLIELYSSRLPDEYPLQHLTLHIYDTQDEKNTFWKYSSNTTDVLSQMRYLRTLDLRFGAGESGMTAQTHITLPMLTHLHISAPTNLLSTTSAAIQTSPTAYRSYTIQIADARQLLLPGTLEEIRRVLRLSPVLHALDEDLITASYTRLDITPARDNPAGFLRIVASGPTGIEANTLPPIVDVSFEDHGIIMPYKAQSRAVWPPIYGEMLHLLLSTIPLSALDALYIADGVDRIKLKEYDAPQTAFQVRPLWKHFSRARTICIAFYPVAVLPLFEAALQAERLEHIVLQSMVVGDELGAIKLLPRLNATAKARRVLVSVRDCAIAERDLRALQTWAGSDNFDWDERQVVDCTPSWGASDSPWLAPDARETRFWRPEVWEGQLCTPGEAGATT